MKNIVITGVSSGIGKASVQYFLKKGYRVFGSVRKEEDARQLSKEWGERFVPLVFDLQDSEAIESAASKVHDIIGDARLDALVNNAGISVNGPLAYIEPEEFSKQLDVNVLGVLRVTQAFLPLLGFNNDRPKGHIVNISSGSGRVTRPFMGPYSASKFALESLSDGLRRELLDFGIGVTIIEPGPIKSEIWTKAKSGKTEEKYADTPYGKIYEKLPVMVSNMEKIALDAEKVAALIYGVVEGEKGKTRYLIAPKRWLFWLAIHVMPDRMLDKMFQKQFNRLVNG
ncbi:SDR family oxidoreductase [Robertkochia aurantiaca]|uniref:SDR family oxidoreductase n=1 Tax=Robertkochia aurantiaca TaxID=2873700 RepID=UPI001CC9CC0D|nr:SDR family oxidoreductase [Robertkochia sp. 3YJGBD-33]